MSNLPCPPAQWSRFSALLDSAMEVPQADRVAWLERLSGEDAAVRPWLARVLAGAANSHTGSFLDRRDIAAPHGGFAAGDTVGPYRLDARLGEGGMGEVWRARRLEDGPRREVALKLPHAELLGGPFRQRFARERDVLAALSHPHIAQLYDAGLSADGHPYLALELVEGQSITAACRAERASLHRRVELVCQVLDALTYAHQRLIVHRDIKPSNVLVTPEGGVKLLDFGIAKLLRPEGSDELPPTHLAGRLATPGYAAPEQLCDGAITVATDIFAAGVLLFELCTGQRPFARVPLEPDAPPAPLASARADAASTGSPEGSGLARLLRGDMDAVIARALALAPAERYGSAEAFALDLRCCRDGRPVSARRIGWLTRTQKFVRRNKAGVGLAGVLAVSLALGTAGVAWQARRAEREAARATAIKDYLIGLFENLYPQGGKPNDRMTAKELLDIGADRADAAFANDPATEIDLLGTLQSIYDVSDDADRAEKVAVRRLELQRLLYGPNDPRVLNATVDLVVTQMMYLDGDRARAMLDQIRAGLFAHSDAQSLPRALFLYAHASTLRTVHGGRDQAIAECQAAIHILQTHFPRDSNYPDALMVLSGYLMNADRNEDALRSLEQSRIAATSLGKYDAMAQLQYDLLKGEIVEPLGRLDEAERIFTATQEHSERLVGRQSTWFVISLVNRARLLHRKGDRAQALTLFATALPLGGDRLASTGFITQIKRFYGALLEEEGDAAPAIPLLQAGLAQEQSRPREEDTVRKTEIYLGDAYDQVGEADKARALLQAARDEWVRFGAPAGTPTLAARERWGRFLLAHGDPQGAADEFNRLLAIAGDAPSAPAALAQAGLARIALARGDTKTAAAASARAMQTLAAITQEYDVRARVDVWLARAESLRADGQIAAARAMAQQAVTASEQTDAPTSPRLARARDALRKIG